MGYALLTAFKDLKLVLALTLPFHVLVGFSHFDLIKSVSLLPQVEHDSFFLRAVKCIFSSKKLGMWQYLAVIPYGTLSLDMTWRIYYFLHFVGDQEAEDESTLENLHSLSKLVVVVAGWYNIEPSWYSVFPCYFLLKMFEAGFAEKVLF